MVETNYTFSDLVKSQSDMISKNTSTFIDSYASKRKYTQAEIIDIIENGSSNSQQQLSRDFYESNGIYKHIINYYSTLLTYSGILIPNLLTGKSLSSPSIMKKYTAALNYVEQLQIPILLEDIARHVLLYGSYYGIVLNNSDDGCGIINLPYLYCRSRYKDLFGNDIVEFNVVYFDTIIDEIQRNITLNSYPKSVRKQYHKYSKGLSSTTWVQLPPEVGVYFSFGDTSSSPLFLSMISSVLEYEDAVDVEQERAIDEIRKIIVQQIPHLNDGTLLFEPPEAVEIHRGTVGMMKGNKNLSVLTTYGDVSAIVSKSSSDTTSNTLDRMLQNIYSESGVSQQLFAPTGSSALSTSIKNDISFMMVLANRFSHFISLLVNNLYSTNSVNFKYQILPITYYNQSEFISDALKLAQSGYSFLLPSIAIGVSQRDLINLKELENNCINLRELLIPLSSSYTQSANTDEGASDSSEQGGRPALEEEERSEQTIKNRQSIENQGEEING